MRYIILGDSIAFGFNDIKNKGWAGRLKKHTNRINKDKFSRLTRLNPLKRKVFRNYSVPGYTSRDLLRIINKKLKKHLKFKKENTIIIAIGTNDSKVDFLNPIKNISEIEFKMNILRLIKTSKIYAKKVIILGLLPVYQIKTTPIRKKIYYYNKRIKKYNEILKICAKQEKIYFKDFFNNWFKKDIKSLFKDGLHPDNIAHQIYFEEIKNIL